MFGRIKEMQTKSKVITVVVVIIIIAVIGFWRGWFGGKNRVNPLNLNAPGGQSTAPVNAGNVSPFSGIACANWNRRPIAVMEAADLSVRPDSGFSDADLVLEMPAITASITRLMPVYVCNDPAEVGSIRSTRHDYIALAAGWDAVLAHWGGSHFAADILNKGTLAKGGVIDDLDLNGSMGNKAPECGFRKEGIPAPDNGFAKFPTLVDCAQKAGFDMTDKFSGYPHQAEASIDQRPKGGDLRVGFAKPYDVDYTYDQASNTYLRTWGGVADVDANNGKRNAPKNVVVAIATSEQIEGQYNNVQIGDPQFDTVTDGDAHYYFNGQEYTGKWHKDNKSWNSKLYFYDNNGQEMKFVPGQIWVEVLEPGQALRWTPTP